MDALQRRIRRSLHGIRSAGWVLGLAGVLAGCTANTTDKDIRFISGAEVQRLVNKSAESPLAVVLLDPRPKAEFEAEHIAGSWNLTLPMAPIGQAPEARLNSFDSIVVYGNNPGSATARGLCKRLISNRYSPDIYLFSGGLEEWKAQGGQVASGVDDRRIGPR